MAKRKDVSWRNRIIRTGEARADSLLANSDNWRIHGAQQQAVMRALIGGHVGWIQSIIVNLRTDKAWGSDQGVETVVDGHMRVQLALREGDETMVPVTYVDLMPKEERLALASFDKIAALADTDDDQYSALLAGLSDLPEELTSLLAGRKEHAKRERRPCLCCRERCLDGCVCRIDQKERT